ncbi:hypothetical protein PIB30_019090 [Stylosanthes scabra]|uniref:Homeobox domain-containing protein n=1 Tax=Stylosanthes scabra TaxID=79078 RepID=A0ABU6U9S4_9FABA|nr:hypothetical protein [Stylosanthes scabra]
MQLQVLQELFGNGIKTPSTLQIQHIASQLQRFGKIQGKNVFYWFQNHKAMERRKRRCHDSEGTASSPQALKEKGCDAKERKKWASSTSKCNVGGHDFQFVPQARELIRVVGRIVDLTTRLGTTSRNTSSRAVPMSNCQEGYSSINTKAKPLSGMTYLPNFYHLPPAKTLTDLGIGVPCKYNPTHSSGGLRFGLVRKQAFGFLS